MKKSDAERAARLADALDDIAGLRNALKGDDCPAFAYVYLPLEVGDIVLPLIEQWVRDELLRLGVEPDA